MSTASDEDAARPFLARLLWKWVAISILFIMGTTTCECLTLSIANAGWPIWATTIWTYATYSSLGLAVIFALLALMTAHQRSHLKKR